MTKGRVKEKTNGATHTRGEETNNGGKNYVLKKKPFGKGVGGKRPRISGIGRQKETGQNNTNQKEKSQKDEPKGCKARVGKHEPGTCGREKRMMSTHKSKLSKGSRPKA